MTARPIVLGLLLAAIPACASKDDVTPTIIVSPGVKERMMVMDRFRHYGAPRRLLPRVTVEEVDEADLPLTTDDGDPPETPDEDGDAEDASTPADAGAPAR